VAISVDGPDANNALAKRLSVKFPLLSDAEGVAAQAYGVWDSETEIALAATFVVAKGGKIVYRMIGKDKTDRPSVDQVLGALPKDEKD
jgi:peroxiredoxin